MDSWQKFEPQIKAFAKELSSVRETQEDLEQEMRIALLELEDGETDTFYLTRIKSRAKDSLRAFHQRADWFPESKTGYETDREIPFGSMEEYSDEETMW